MGQIQNKTYTAPDGSVYKVEDDGSITKIKGGKIQSNEPPSKYQITPEGKIYRVESDGSVTYLGNAEEKNNLQFDKDNTIDTPKEKSHTWIWIVIILAAGIIGACIMSFVRESSYKEQILENSYVEESGDNQIQVSSDAIKNAPEEIGCETYDDTSYVPADSAIDNSEVEVFISHRPFYWDDNAKEFREAENLMWNEGQKVTLTGKIYMQWNPPISNDVS